MNAKQIIGVLDLKVEHGLYRDNGYWYHHLKKFPGILADAEGYVVFETQKAYQENEYLQHAQTLHVKNGISSIPGYVVFTEEQQFKLINFFTIINQINIKIISSYFCLNTRIKSKISSIKK